MNKKTSFFLMPSLILLSVLLISWGSSGHYLISLKMTQHLPDEMEEFKSWSDYLSEHASDPDYRKGDDPTEGPKHYIDIDNYPEFLENGSIEMDLDKLIQKHDAGFVGDQGYLPWATITTYDSLVACFKRKDMDRAKFFAADLGHYVGDGHMPLHITANYDGQIPGEDGVSHKGIHRRFESYMINDYVNEIQIEKQNVIDIEDVSEFIFSYIYENNKYVDSIIDADSYGRSINSSTSSQEYIDAMWDYSKDFTVKLFNEASVSFASLFCKAWQESQETETDNTSIQEQKSSFNTIESFPNPVDDILRFRMLENYPEQYDISLYSIMGQKISNISNGVSFTSDDIHSYNTGYLCNGNYFIVLRTDEGIVSSKILVQH